MRNIFKTLLLSLALVTMVTGVDRVQYKTALQLPSNWLNTAEVNKTVNLGQLVWDVVGRANTTGFLSNVGIVPNGSNLNINVGPAVTNSYGSVYQVAAIDTSAFGDGSGQIAANANQVYHQYLIKSTQVLGPLTAPSGGNSVIDLVECHGTTSDTTSQSVFFSSTSNIRTSGTANRDRVDAGSCQVKAGTPAGSPTVPSTDSGWLAAGIVTLPSGVTSITGGMITVYAQGLTIPAGAASSLAQPGTNVTGCFICYGTLGVASTGFIRMGNADTTGYTSLATGNTSTIAGVVDKLLGIGDTGVAKAGLNTSGSLGLAGSLQALGSVIAGQATAATVSFGDLTASRSSTTGALVLGGSSSNCVFDYGVTASGDLSSNCLIQATGVQQVATNVTGCFFCYGTLGATSAAVLRFGNNLTGTAYTSIGAPNNGSVAGVTSSLVSITNTGTKVVNIDGTGNIGTAGGVTALGAIVSGGTANAPAFSSGDVVALRSTTTGAMWIGGSSSSCRVDYQLTASGAIGLNCGLQLSGNVYAAGGGGNIFSDQTIVAGFSNGSPLTLVGGDLVSTRSSSTGELVLGGSGITHGKGTLDYGIRSGSGTFTFAAGTGVYALGQFYLATNTGTNYPTLNAGDLGTSEGASSGLLAFGGSTNQCNFDYGVTTSQVSTLGCPFNASSYVVAGWATAATATAGDLEASRGVSSGALVLGGSTNSCRIDYGVTNGGFLGVQSGCNWKMAGTITSGGLTDTALSSATVSMLCGANATAVSQCASQSVLMASTGATNAATGTSANTYVQLGATQSVTTGTSLGTNGEWLITVHEYVSVATLSVGESEYGCIQSSSTVVSTLYNTVDGATGNCQTALANSVAGAPDIGRNTSSGIGNQSNIEVAVLVANSTTYSAKCYVAGTTTTSITMYGHCTIRAEPY